MSNLACSCVLPCASLQGTSAPVALEGAGTAEVLPSLLPRGVSGQCGCDEGCVDPNAKPFLEPWGTLPSLIFHANRGLPSLLILPSHPPSLPPSLASSRDGQRDAKDFDGHLLLASRCPRSVPPATNSGQESAAGGTNLEAIPVASSQLPLPPVLRRPQ
jgi:hypothetical protein